MILGITPDSAFQAHFKVISMIDFQVLDQLYTTELLTFDPAPLNRQIDCPAFNLPFLQDASSLVIPSDHPFQLLYVGCSNLSMTQVPWTL